MKAGRSKHELRCFCSRKPLLAVYGIDTDGRLFIHVKIYKQNRIYGELLFKGGDVAMMCRECCRWHRIFIREGTVPQLTESPKPEELETVANDAGSNEVASTIVT